MAARYEPVSIAPTQIRQGAIVLSRAFHDDAAMCLAIPDDAERARMLPIFFAPVIRAILHAGEAVTTAGTLRGAALWLPPGHTTLPPDEMERAGMGIAMAQWEPGAAERLQANLGVLEELHERLMPEPHWRLEFLGIDPPYQRQGVGTALITAGIAHAEAAGAPCYLDTIKAANVRYYERHGFRVIGEEEFAGSDVHIWAMRRR